MKALIVSVACLSGLGFASGALAAPPQGKATILHCGCVLLGTGPAMQYVQISVASNAKGHLNHVAGSIDSCFNGVDTFVDFVRTGSDCQISAPANSPLDALSVCDTTVVAAGGTCGTPVVQQ